ncbi:TonB-dependent receptor [Mesorhizobium sp. SB112]|uniref:TonB-dependent receptor n=1 Tax=Mesorhizobium sp. SB112 TaxID=3151853 RepID=UPI0032655435
MESGQTLSATCRPANTRLASILLASTILGCASPLASTAAQARPAAGASETVNFQIPAQTLSSALNAFIRQSGWQISYSSALARGKTSAAISGSMTPETALQRLVAGTGAAVRVGAPGSAALVDATAAGANGGVAADGSLILDTITIQGANPNSTFEVPEVYAGGQVARGGQVGMLGNRDVMNMPFSQTSYTAKKIRDQQARTLNEVMDNDPSVIATSQGVYRDAETIRGFQTYGHFGVRSLNGLSGMAPLLFPSTDYIERVEVLKGPSALLNGMSAAGNGNLGGSVNLITKQASDESITRLTTRYISDSQFGAHADIGRRFGANNEFGIRFNGSLSGGDTPVDIQTSKDKLAALNLDYRGERLRMSADIAHQSQDLSPRSSTLSIRPVLGTLAVVPSAPSARTSLFPYWDEGRSYGTLGMVRGEFDINDNLTAYAAVGAQRFSDDIDATAPAVLLDATGRYSITPWTQKSTYDTFSTQGGIRGTATTGPVDHDFSLNVSHTSYVEKYSIWIGSSTIVDSIYNPVFGPAPSFVDPGQPNKVTDTSVTSIGVADTLSFLDDRIQLTAGIRYQTVQSEGFNYITGAQTSSYDSDAWTPTFGVVVKPWENVSLYANYIEGLQPGTTVGTTYANAGEVFAPYVTKQYEAGVKVDWGPVTTTLAVFQVAQPSAIGVPDAGGGLPTLALDGEQRNRGIELNAYGEVFDSVRLLGGVTFLEARQTKTASGAFDGERAAGVPKVRAVIGAEWDTPFVEGLTLTGRVAYTSDQVVVNDRPDLKLPAWTQVDLGARYSFDSPWNEKPITIHFNVDNVFNESYWKGSYNYAFLSLSAPRTFRLSTTFDF